MMYYNTTTTQKRTTLWSFYIETILYILVFVGSIFGKTQVDSNHDDSYLKEFISPRIPQDITWRRYFYQKNVQKRIPPVDASFADVSNPDMNLSYGDFRGDYSKNSRKDYSKDSSGRRHYNKDSIDSYSKDTKEKYNRNFRREYEKEGSWDQNERISRNFRNSHGDSNDNLKSDSKNVMNLQQDESESSWDGSQSGRKSDVSNSKQDQQYQSRVSAKLPYESTLVEPFSRHGNTNIHHYPSGSSLGYVDSQLSTNNGKYLKLNHSHNRYDSNSAKNSKNYAEKHPNHRKYINSQKSNLNIFRDDMNPARKNVNLKTDGKIEHEAHRPLHSQGQTLDRSYFKLPFGEYFESEILDFPKLEAPRQGRYNDPRQAVPISSSHFTKEKRSNIILIITDDLDVELGSLNYMPRLLRLMGDGGALLLNSYTTTPMCCPSRSSMLTGMYIHNHEVFTNHQNCSSPQWQSTHERRSFASYLSNAGYITAYFGKYLNRYNGSHVPHGWHEWGAQLMNSRYYNYTVNRNSQHVKYGNKYPHDYYPHVITNDGLRFLRENKGGSNPFLLVLSYPSPHGPEDSAPEHAHKFFNASDHHTASYNYAPNPDKQWMLQFTHRMPDIQLKYTDLLMTKRLQTMQTIDFAIEKIINSVREIGEEENTYIFFTSDHGYHLGQFGLAKGKSMPFEFDIKVPFLVRGPGIHPGTDLPQIALNIDIAPTFLDIAGVTPPPHMDGRSLLPVLRRKLIKSIRSESKQWRDSFLVESSGRLREEEKLEKKEQRTWERERALTQTLLKASSFIDGVSNTSSAHDPTGSSPHVSLYTSKHEKLEEVCQREEFALPCKDEQKWHCLKIGSRWKIKKCRKTNKSLAIWQKHCICHFLQGFGTYRKLDVKERRKQRNFLKKYVTKDFHAFDSKFIKSFKNVHIPLQFGRRTTRYHGNARSHKRKRNGRNRFQRSVHEIERNDTYVFPFDFNMVNLTNILNFDDEEAESYSDEGTNNDTEDTDFDHPAEPTEEEDPSSHPDEEDSPPLGFIESVTDESVHDFVEEEELRDLKDQIIDIADEIQSLESVSNSSSSIMPTNTSVSGSSDHGCHANEGQIDCQDEVYENMMAWTSSKVAIEDHIRRLRQQLHVMKNILTHLQAKKPDLFKGYPEDDYDNFQDYTKAGAYNASDLEEPLLQSELEEITEERNTGVEVPVEESLDATSNSVNTFPDAKDLGRNKELNLPEVGLEIPLVEDVYSHGNHRKTKPTEAGNKKPNFPRKKPVDRDYYFDNEYEDEEASHRGGRLYYPVSLSSIGDEITGNESAPNRFCWCDRRIIQKINIQKARERKRLERQKIKEKRQQRKMRKKKKNKDKPVPCNYSTLNCYTHDNDHWRTPPLWTDGEFCFCINSANNTYWCLRTINETHNFLYCEFITGLITYYDLHIDPYQMRNVAFTLSSERVLELNERLTVLRSCKGADECDGRVPKQAKENSKSDVSLDTLEKSNMEYPQKSKILGYISHVDEASLKRKKIKKMEERHKKRLRKEKKKQKKTPEYQEFLESLAESSDMGMNDFQQNVRIPRKSRHKRLGKKQRKEKKRERKRKKERERKNRKRDDQTFD